MKKAITFRFSEEVIMKLKKLAKEENRNVTNYLENLILESESKQNKS